MTRSLCVAVLGLLTAGYACAADPAFDRAKARVEKVGAELKKPSNSEFYEQLFFDFSKASEDDVAAIADDLKKAKAESKVRITHVTLAPGHGDKALAKVTQFTTLEVLDIRKGKVPDKGLAAVKPLKNLKVLRAFQTGIGDEGLKHLTGLGELHYLDLEETKVTDVGLKQLTKLSLNTLKVKGTKVTAEGAKLFKAGVVER
jgi:hypothetical protein